AAVAAIYYESQPVPQPMHTSILTGQRWLDELLDGHPQRFREQLGISQEAFRTLSRDLQVNYGHHDSRFVTADEQIAIFLY
ncbi:hypothetical protein BDN72DRAFT_729736, partial [Pluteus cervinus]